MQEESKSMQTITATPVLYIMQEQGTHSLICWPEQSLTFLLRYFYEQISEWIPTFASLGIPTGDPASGVTTGAYISTSAIKTE